ncbi:MAG TPA: hypothetical protein VN397_01800, partial [Candidatus Methylomirabilis sp.]|nr:hypothetical protein [Candidatus Methylomirabilis sp.]
MVKPAWSLRLTAFVYSIVAACANGDPPPKQPVIPVVTIPFAHYAQPERPDPQPVDPPTGDATEVQPSQNGWGAAASESWRGVDAQCAYYIVGDPEQKMYSRRILALAEAWRKGLVIRSVEMTCYTLRISAPIEL